MFKDRTLPANNLHISLKDGLVVCGNHLQSSRVNLLESTTLKELLNNGGFFSVENICDILSREGTDGNHFGANKNWALSVNTARGTLEFCGRLTTDSDKVQRH